MMSDIRISVEKFLKAYNQSLGVEGARNLMKEVITQAGLPQRKEYSKEEAIKLCEFLKKKPGFVRIIAFALAGQILIEKQPMQ